MNTEQLEERITLTEAGVPINAAKNNLSRLINDLNDDDAVVITLRNKPRAALVDIEYYLDLKAKAEAYDLLQIAEEAEHKPKITFEEAEARILRGRAAREQALAEAA